MRGPRFTGGVLCAAASFMLLLCSLQLSARESVGAGILVALLALGLLHAAVSSLRAGAR